MGAISVIVSAFLAAFLTAYYAAKRFRSEKWWDRKAAAYSELLSVLYEIMHAIKDCYCKSRENRRAIAVNFALCGMVLFSYTQVAHAWSLSDMFGPSVDEVDFSYTWRHATKEDDPGMDPSFTFANGYKPIPLYLTVVVVAKLKNNSKLYLTNANIICDFFDANRNRLAKDQGFNWHIENYSIAPGNTGVWTFTVSNFNLKIAAVADCKLTRVIGEK